MMLVSAESKQPRLTKREIIFKDLKTYVITISQHTDRRVDDLP